MCFCFLVYEFDSIVSNLNSMDLNILYVLNILFFLRVVEFYFVGSFFYFKA